MSQTKRTTWADWENRISNIVVTAVVLYLGTIANGLGTKIEVLSLTLKQTATALEDCLKRVEVADRQSIENKYKIADLYKQVDRLLSK